MDISIAMNQALITAKNIWDKQTKPRKYLAIIAIAFPSLIILRNLYWYLYRKYHSLPPGPNGLPFIGYALTAHSGTKARVNLANKYGPIFYTYYVGSPCIVLSSSKLVKQVFAQKEFSNRGFEGPYHPTVVNQPSIFSFGKSQALPMSFVDGDCYCNCYVS